MRLVPWTIDDGEVNEIDGATVSGGEVGVGDALGLGPGEEELLGVGVGLGVAPVPAGSRKSLL
jgi:hypothetical protein